MMPVTASAPGKIILFGEHAVVYGQPALAVPLHGLTAKAQVEPTPAGSGLVIEALDINTRLLLANADHPLVVAAQLTLDTLGVDEPDALLTLHSTSPIASGLGSGAAVSAALARALSEYLGQPLATEELSALVYEIEKLHHGTPSGIDNTVICYGKPVYFVRGRKPDIFHTDEPFHLLIGDTGRPGSTKQTVGAVRVGWQQDPAAYQALFEQVGSLVQKARTAIENGQVAKLGPLMIENQRLLQRMGVSSPELNTLICAAVEAGAPGAKLSGGGGGGNMIALVNPDDVGTISRALYDAGAANVIHTTVS